QDFTLMDAKQLISISHAVLSKHEHRLDTIDKHLHDVYVEVSDTKNLALDASAMSHKAVNLMERQTIDEWVELNGLERQIRPYEYIILSNLMSDYCFDKGYSGDWTHVDDQIWAKQKRFPLIVFENRLRLILY